uniref:Eva-1 homolog Ba (C. elegans) n=1 Tax=Oryzias melastigma TaxID=30732 RepID=A0A3B3CHF1_ORYME
MDVKKKEMELLSNSIAAMAHIKANPESFGLYFVLGVCFGLVLTLCLLVIRISCKPRTNISPSTPEKKQLKSPNEDQEDSDDEEEEEEEDADELEPRSWNGPRGWRRENGSSGRSGGTASRTFSGRERGLLEECTTIKIGTARDTLWRSYKDHLGDPWCL